MKNFDKENRTAYLLTVIIFLLYVVHALLLDGSYGGGDGIRHYLVSRFCWKHPELLVYHWGKPFFTLVSSPFAQFGLLGIKLFNAAIGALTAYYSYRIAKKLGFSNTLATIVFASFAPVYVFCVNSGLTEPLFGFMLIVAIYLYLEQKYLFATILLSFLPYVRSEGNMMIPLFLLVLAFRKKWAVIPWMAFGTVLYSIAGYFYYHDILWIVTKNPYDGSNSDIYSKGAGDLFEYSKLYDLILGLPLTILFVGGLIWMLIKIAKKPSETISTKSHLFEEIVLIFGSGIIYFAAHSVFRWKGLFGDLALERTIAAVVPPAILVGMRGLELITMPFSGKKLIRNAIVVAFGAWIVYYPIRQKYVPMKLDPEEQLVKIAADWYVHSEYKDEMIYYLHPYFMHKLNLDAFDGKRVGELWGLYPAIREWGIDVVPLNTVVFWDAHFGANEAYIPLDSIMSDPNFKLIKSFRPEQPFTTLGGYDFEIHAFLRVKPTALIKSAELNFDLETPAGLGNEHLISEEKAASGKKSGHVRATDEYGLTFDHRLNDFQDFENMGAITFNFNIYSDKPVNDLLMVMSIDNGGEPLQWVGTPVSYTASGKWVNISMTFNLNPGLMVGANKLQIYPWNKGRNDFFIDDLNFGFQSRK